MTKDIDHARLAIIFNDLRLPAIKHGWPILAERADKRGWPAARFLAALAEHKIANAIAAASSGISPRPSCRQANPSIASTTKCCQ